MGIYQIKNIKAGWVCVVVVGLLTSCEHVPDRLRGSDLGEVHVTDARVNNREALIPELNDQSQFFDEKIRAIRENPDSVGFGLAGVSIVETIGSTKFSLDIDASPNFGQIKKKQSENYLEELGRISEEKKLEHKNSLEISKKKQLIELKEQELKAQELELELKDINKRLADSASQSDTPAASTYEIARARALGAEVEKLVKVCVELSIEDRLKRPECAAVLAPPKSENSSESTDKTEPVVAEVSDDLKKEITAINKAVSTFDGKLDTAIVDLNKNKESITALENQETPESKLNKATSDLSATSVKPGNATQDVPKLSGVDELLKTLSPSFIDKTKDQSEGLKFVYGEKRKVEFDYIHDLHGNTLVELQFGLTLSPRDNVESVARVSIQVEPGSLSESEYPALINNWRYLLEEKMNIESREFIKAYGGFNKLTPSQVHRVHIESPIRGVDVLDLDDQTQAKYYEGILSSSLKKDGTIDCPNNDCSQVSASFVVLNGIFDAHKSDIRKVDDQIIATIDRLNEAESALSLAKVNNPNKAHKTKKADVTSAKKRLKAHKRRKLEAQRTRDSRLRKVYKEILVTRSVIRKYLDQKGLDKAFWARVEVSQLGGTATNYPHIGIAVVAKDKSDFKTFLAETRVNPISVYKVTPEEIPQPYLETLSSQKARETDLKAGGVLGSVGVNAAYNSLRSKEQFIAQLKRNPVVVGFADVKDSKAVFGWLLAPQFSTDIGPTYKNNVKFKQQKVHYNVGAYLSVPAWYSSLKYKVFWEWIPRGAGERPLTFDGADEREVALVPSYDALIGASHGVVERKPIISSIFPTRAANGDDLSLLIKGAELWRKPTVFVGTDRAEKVSITNNMGAVLAEFSNLNVPESQCSRGSIDGCDCVVPVTVFTSVTNGSSQTVEMCVTEQKKARVYDVAVSDVARMGSELKFTVQGALLDNITAAALGGLVSTKIEKLGNGTSLGIQFDQINDAAVKGCAQKPLLTKDDNDNDVVTTCEVELKLFGSGVLKADNIEIHPSNT